MTRLSKGAQHYVLMLIPSLIRDIEALGLPKIIRTSGFSEREVTSLYFEFLAINRVLPATPERIAPEIWEHLVYCVQVMSAMVNAASLDDLIQAREQAVRRYLPHARQALEAEFQEQRREGAVEFRLATLLRQDGTPEHSREVCMEAIRREREQRFDAVKDMTTEGLNACQAEIVEAAKAFVVREMAEAPDDFDVLDLVVRLLDLLRLVLELEKRAPVGAGDDSAELSVERILLGLGNVLYKHELGLAATG